VTSKKAGWGENRHAAKKIAMVNIFVGDGYPGLDETRSSLNLLLHLNSPIFSSSFKMFKFIAWNMLFSAIPLFWPEPKE